MYWSICTTVNSLLSSSYEFIDNEDSEETKNHSQQEAA